MFRFTIRDLLWPMLMVGLGCWGLTEHWSRVAMGYQLSFSESQMESLANLVESEGYRVEVVKGGVENAENAGRVKRLRECLYEAEPGVYYLGPRNDAMSRANEAILQRYGKPLRE